MTTLLLVLSLSLAGQDDLKPGLVGEYVYTGERMTSFYEGDAKPRFKRVDKRIDFDRTAGPFHGTKLVDDFYVRWSGVLRVPKPGKWKLYTVSDDGSRLLLRGKLVVDNGGSHEMREAAGEVELEAGDHEIRVEYFERYAHAGIRVLWEGPGQNKDVVPAHALFHKGSAAPSEEEKKAIETPLDPPKPKEAKAVAPKEKPKDEPRREPEKAGGPYDEKVVGPGESTPDFSGRVSNVFEDGPTTLVTVRRGGEERPIFVNRETKVLYLDLVGAERRPTAGFGAYVWFKPGSPDTAATIKFSK